MTNVVVFCGGRGSTTILTSLARTRNVELSVVINAYDAGLSTGRVRHAFRGLLGPSDVRKTTSTLALAAGDPNQKALAALLETRLASDPKGMSPEAGARARDQLDALVDGQLAVLDRDLADLIRQLPVHTWFQVRHALLSFQKSLADAGVPFAHDDLAVGNAVLAGFFAEFEEFPSAVAAYQDLVGLDHQRVCNVTRGEDLWLSARAGDVYCPDEGTLVTGTLPAPITDLFLLPRDGHKLVYGDRQEWLTEEQLDGDPALSESLPLIDPAVADRVRTADVIVYGPGTQHSSLFPTYLTIGLGEAVAENVRATKLFVANVDRDNDQHAEETIADGLDKFQFFMSRRGAVTVSFEQLVSRVLVPDQSGEHLASLPWGVEVRRAVWADPSGRHSGPAVQEEIASVVRMRTGEQLPGDSGLATVVVPVLNERRHIDSALQELRYLDLSEVGLVHEIVVVDGGSTDGTAEFLRSEPDITLLETRCKGRGEAVRAGLAKARGEFVVVFPADNEYDEAVIVSVLQELQREPEAAVLASRTLGGSSAGQRLRNVYADNRLLYIISHWGGVAVTLLLMLRLDRVISDPLSGVRGARRDVFRELDNPGMGLDYDVRWVIRAAASGRRILEVPAGYRPRSWRDGKKTSIWDGFSALRSLMTRDGGVRR